MFAYTLNDPDTALDLAAAMRTNPYLKVLSLNGWYDMATPFFGTEYDLGHMMLEPAQQRNLEFRYYPSGHMVYLNPDALHLDASSTSKLHRSDRRRSRSGSPSRLFRHAGATGNLSTHRCVALPSHAPLLVV